MVFEFAVVTIHPDLPLCLWPRSSQNLSWDQAGRQACEVDTPILTMLNFRCVRAAFACNSNEIEHKAIDIGTIEKDEEKEAGDMTKSLRSYCTNHFAATRPGSAARRYTESG